MPRGTMILEAAQKAGIRIPTLCNSKRLHPFGACRLCVVQQKGRRGLIPACFNPVRSSMEILTNTPEVVKARRTQLQLILVSHPLDCPVCDAGGQCRLQDLVYEYGIADNPFQGPKLEEPVDHVTPFIERNVNRCILCGMCVRIDDEVVGVNELSFLNRGDKVRIGTDFNRPMDCEFCGQCISVCPVGALNDRLFLHKARPWDLRETNTVCGYCSVGCSIVVGARDGRIVRVRSDEDLGANKGNLCVKGRFGWEYVQSPERLTTPLVRRGDSLVPCTWQEAIGIVAQRFLQIRERGEELGGLGSARLTNEEAYLFQKLLRGALYTNNVDHAGGYAYTGHLALRESLGYAASTGSFRDIQDADVILALRSDLSETHPVAKYEVVQAVKKHRAKLIVVNSRAVRLNKFASLDLRVRPGTEIALLNGMLRMIMNERLVDEAFIRSRAKGLDDLRNSLAGCTPDRIESITGVPAQSLREAALCLANAGQAVILVSAGSDPDSGDAMLLRAAANLALVAARLGNSPVRIMLMGEKNNTQGALDMGLSPSLLPGYRAVEDRSARDRLTGLWGMPAPVAPGMNAPAMLKAAEEGRLKGLYVVGENPLAAYPDAGQAERALAALDFLVVQDCFLTETAVMAHVVLPAAAFAEKEGTYTSAERRVQHVRPAVLPPGQAHPDLWILNAIAREMQRPLTEAEGGGAPETASRALCEAVMKEIRAAIPLYGGIDYTRLDAQAQNAGLQWPCTSADDPGTPLLYEKDFPEGKARLFPVEWEDRPLSGEYPWILVSGPVLFHSGTVSLRSAGLKRLRGEAWIEINPEDAGKLGCTEGERLVLESPLGKAGARAVVTGQTAPGVVFMPHHFGLANQLRGWDGNLTRVNIKKE